MYHDARNSRGTPRNVIRDLVLRPETAIQAVKFFFACAIIYAGLSVKASQLAVKIDSTMETVNLLQKSQADFSASQIGQDKKILQLNNDSAAHQRSLDEFKASQSKQWDLTNQINNSVSILLERTKAKP